MSAEITRYQLVDAADQPWGSEHDRYEEALAMAQFRTGRGEPTAVTELVYEYADSNLVWTPNGAEVWP